MVRQEERSDGELLAEFTGAGCEKAFAALVQRHIGLVYSAAFRKLHDAHLAEDVAQAVFVLLARKASQLRPGVVLPGWLYRTAQFTARDVLKAEGRRLRREQLSQNDSGETFEPQSFLALESALERLSEMDRLVVLLRFFEEKSVREVGRAIGLGEEAARKRLDRAVHKLRAFLDGRNGLLPGADIGRLLSAYPKSGLPEGAAIRATTTALAETVAMSGSILRLVRAALREMLLARLKRLVPICALSAFSIVLALSWTRGREPLLPASEVVGRHFETLDGLARADQALPASGRAACLRCHESGGREPTVRGICLRGEWQSLSEALSGTFEIRMAGPERVLETITLSPGQTISRGRDAALAWMVELDGRPRRLTTAETTDFSKESSVLLSTEKFEVSGFARKSAFRGQSSYVINAPQEADYYFARETGLFQGAVWKNAGGEFATNIIGGYRAFRGMTAPDRIVRSSRNSEQVFLVQSVRVRDLPLRIFDPPPELRTMQ